MDFYDSFKHLKHSVIHFSVHKFSSEVTVKLTNLKLQDPKRILATRSHKTCKTRCFNTINYDHYFLPSPLPLNHISPLY